MRFILTFSLTCFLSLLFGQIDFPDYLAEDFDKKTYENFLSRNSAGGDPVEKLDSILGYNNLNNVLFRKSTFAYDELGRDTLESNFSYDFSVDGLFESNRIITSYDDTSRLRTTLLAPSADLPLINQERALTIFDTEGRIKRIVEEDWDDNSMSWVNDLIRSFEYPHEDSILINNFDWNTDTEQFEPSGKIIQVFGDFVWENISYTLIDNELVPSTRSIIEFNPENSLVSLNTFESYNVDLGVWETQFELTSTFDLDNFTGIRKTKRLTFVEPFELLPFDSSFYTYNTDWQQITQEIHNDYQNGTYSPSLLIEQDYTALGSISQRRILRWDDIATFEPNNFADYYYTIIDVVSVEELDQTPFPAQLIFPNPASKNAIFFLKSEGPDQLFDLQITAINGRRVATQTLRSNQNFDLSTTSITSGIYFLSLSKDDKQKTWKLVIK